MMTLTGSAAGIGVGFVIGSLVIGLIEVVIY